MRPVLDIGVCMAAVAGMHVSVQRIMDERTQGMYGQIGRQHDERRQAVAQLQHKWERPDAVAVAQKPATGEPSARQPVETKEAPAAVSAPPAATPAKPVMPVESTLRHASAQDSLLNDALLVLAAGLLLLLGGLVWVMWGRPAAKA